MDQAGAKPALDKRRAAVRVVGAVLLATLVVPVILGALLTSVIRASSTDAKAKKTDQPKSATSPVLGVQLYSFRNQMKQDVTSTLKQVKGMGFTEVEAAGYNWSSAQEFRRMVDQAGLKVVSFFTSYEKLRDDLESVVAEAKALDARYVIIGWIPHQKEYTAADNDRAIAHFNEWGRKLAERGLRFAYHIHGYEFRPHGKGTLFDKMMAETDPKYVAVEMDVFWVAHPGEDPVKLLKRYGKRVELMHLKDMQKGLKGDFSGHVDVETNVTIGTGQIDFPAVIRAARQAGVRYYFIEDESSRVMEQVPQSFKFLKPLFN